MNVFDYHEYDSFEQFHTELQSVFEFLRYSEEGELLEKKLKENRERYGSLSNEAKALLMELTGMKKIPGVKEEERKRGEFEMCKAFEYMEEKGRLEGKAEEIVESGYEFGLSEDSILERLQRKLNISMEEARKLFSMFRIYEPNVRKL